jgi:alanyl-tRNA synthetase
VEKLLHEITEIKGIKLVTSEIPDISEEEAIEIASQISQRDASTVTVLGFQSHGTARIITAVGEEALSKGLDAGKITKAIAPHIKGGGGGKPYFGQAGGSDPSGIRKALTEVEQVVEEMLPG